MRAITLLTLIVLGVMISNGLANAATLGESCVSGFDNGATFGNFPDGYTCLHDNSPSQHVDHLIYTPVGGTDPCPASATQVNVSNTGSVYVWKCVFPAGTCDVGDDLDLGTGTCSAPPPTLDCEAAAGSEFQVSYDDYATADCVNGCAVEKAGVFHVGSIATGQTIMRGYYTGASCGAGSFDAPAPVDDTDGCISYTSGSTTNTVCVADTTENCGYFNDQWICANSVPQGSCQFIQGGSYVCADAPQSTPPLPDAGTVGDLAEPDATIDSGNGTTTQVFNSTTVSNSTTTVVNTTSGTGPSGTSGDPLSVEIDEQAIADAVADSLTEQGDFDPIDLSGHAIDTDPATYGSTVFDGLPNTDADSVFSLPVSPTGTCTDPTWTWVGNIVTFDLCSWWVPIRDWIGWFNAFALTIFAYFRVGAILSGRYINLERV